MAETQDPQRQMAVDLFNYTWELLDKPKRSQEENDTMIHAAHASRFHWGKVGTALNLARGEWQISRVYSVVGRGEPALYHALRSLEICRENQIADFDLAFAYEALARASVVAGDRVSARDYYAQAEQAGSRIAEDDDREYFNSELKTIEV
jgi:hypothetical protein